MRSIATPLAHSPRRAGLVAAALALWVASALPAHAAGHRSALADTTKPATFLDQVVVTGARFPRKFYESPQALSFLTSAQLREQPPVVIADLLAKLPGVDMSKDSPWEQRPVLRGMSGQRVLVLMDGIPMNSARGNGPHPSLIDPSQIERVEVVRGPSSVAYGSDALGGAINIITRGVRPDDGSPKMTLKGAIALSGSTGDDQYGGSIDLSPRIGKLGIDVNGGMRHADDFRAPDGKVPSSAFKDWQGAVRARYDLTSALMLDAGWQLYRGSDIGIPGLSTPTATGYGQGVTDLWRFKNYDRDLAHVSLANNYTQSWIASSLVRFYFQGERRNFYDAMRIDSSAYSAIHFPPDGSTSFNMDTDRPFDLKTWGMQVQATSKKTQTYRFTMGLDAARDVTAGSDSQHMYELPASQGFSMVVQSQPVPHGHFDNYGAYFENEWYIVPQWTLSTGARWTQYRYRTDAGLWVPAEPGSSLKVDNGAASGSAGLVYSPSANLHLTANVASGYRQPNAQDLFWNGPGSVGGMVFGNPDLKPEKSVSYDIGMRYENSLEALSGNLFYSDYTDLIDAQYTGTDNLGNQDYKYQNISKARIWGGEAEGEWRLHSNWSAHATIAGAIGDITSREAIEKLYNLSAADAPAQAPLGGVPPLKGSLGLRWNDNDKRFWVEPSMRYSWRTNRLPLPTPGAGQLTDFKKEWLVVDLMAGMRIDYVHRFTLGVRNVGDRRYREALASLPSPGRSLVASFSASF